MKKYILLFCFSFFCFQFSYAQGTWTWVKGSNTANASAVYGTQGVPLAANTPQGLYEPASWTDLQGNFWLFGGVSINAKTNADLWEYNPVTNNWMWMRGTGILGAMGNYGTMGVPAPSNLPSCGGFGLATWVDLNGDLWVYDIGPNLESGEMWRYNIATNTWTWMQGPTGSALLPVYGTRGIPSALNTPGYRSECSSTWVDSTGNLWMFGGNVNSVWENDLWKYDVSVNQWTWMDGSNVGGQSPIYGTQGVADTGNTPGARFAYCSWKDAQGKFWFFGGGEHLNDYNDMWKYDPANNTWAWMSGSNQLNNGGLYGNYCTSSVSEYPASRGENSMKWVDGCGKFWMYGGWDGNYNGYGDLWSFNPLTLQWTLAGGVATVNPVSVYGTMGVANAANTPGGRAGGAPWKCNDGTFYFFGGRLNLGNTYCSDVWHYQPDLNCPAGGAPAPISLGNDTSYCGAFSRLLSTNNAGTTWSTGATAAQITVTTPGKYWATVSASCGVASDTIIITQLANAAAGNIYALPDSVCQSSSTQLTVTGSAGNIQWQSSGDGISFTNIAGATSSTYNSIHLSQLTYFRVKSYNSCGVDSSNLQAINILPLPIAGAITRGRDSICAGTGLTSLLTSNAGTGNYLQWQSSTNGRNFATISTAVDSSYTTPPSLTQTTNYRLLATNNCGTDTSNTVTVHILPAPSTNFTYTINGNQVSFQADSVTGGVITYSWNFGDGKMSTDTNPVHTFDTLKTYYVCLTVYNRSNCSFTYCNYVNTLSTGVKNISSEQNSIRLYPNPANNTINLSVDGLTGNYELKIYNVVGQQVGGIHESPVHNNEPIPIDISTFAPGAYELVLVNDKEYYSKRFVRIK